jgi:hypothetical protein
VDWNAVADALEAAAETVPGINGFSEVPDSIPTIGFYVGEMDVELDATFRRRGGGTTRRGTDQALITCRVLVARYDDKFALRKLRDFMGGSGPSSLMEAISADRTLNGSVDDSHLKRMRGNRLFQVGEMRYYGVELDVFVIGDAG